MRPVAIDAFNAFLNHPDCILTEEHRQQIKDKRGLDDTHIDGFKVRSCRPENASVLADLLNQFGLERCLQLNLYEMIDGTPQPLNMLLQPRELIFYLNQFGEAFHMRPHKLGLAGVPIQPFFAGTDDEDPKRTVLTESEFKAMASRQMGVPAVGIPGIGVFSRELFDRLVEALQAENIPEIVVCFDNEIKNDPNLANYKPDPMKRWDTPFYAIVMAQQLTATKHFGKVKIATLPAAWMVNGKIDIDGALAAGKASEYPAVLAAAQDPDEYLESISDEEGRAIVKKRLELRYLSQFVRISYGRYQVKKTTEDGTEYWDGVSNFSMTFEAKTSSNKVTSREVSLKSARGVCEPETFKLTPECMTSPAKFQEFLYGSGRGTYQFTGNSKDLSKVVDLEHVRARDEVIYEPDHVGLIMGENDVWLFGNGALLNGEWVAPDPRSGACWNGVKGYKAQRAVNTYQQGSSEESDQFVPMPIVQNLESLDIKDIARRIFKNFGGAQRQGYEAMLTLCWNLATPYSMDIYRQLRFFPIMYMLGEPESGKSHLGMWMLSMHGIQIPGSNSDQGSTVGLERTLCYYSSIPAFFDEMRNQSMSAQAKESLLRSVYDRSPIPKGLRTHNNEMRSILPRAPVMIGGEHRPSDEALNTRCLLAVFKKLEPADMHSGLMGSEYAYMTAARRTLLPKVLPWILIHGPAANNVLDEIGKAREALIAAEAGSPRAAQNYAIAAAMYRLLVDDKDEIGFAGWLVEQCKLTKQARIMDSVTGRFLEDIPILAAQNKIQRDVHYRHHNGELALNFRNVYTIWLKEQPNNGRDFPGANSTRDLLVKSGCCYGKPVFVGTSTKQCLVFTLGTEKCPASISEWLTPGFGKSSEPAKPSESSQKSLF